MPAADAPRTAPPRRRATGTMRAAVVTGPGRAALQSLPLLDPGPGEVRIALRGCGVCGSDRPVWEGRPWFEYPRAPGEPGHEGWGYVDAVGDGVTELAIGDAVAALSYHAYADYDIARADAVVRLPPSLAAAPLPGEPLGCAMNVFHRSDIRAGQTLAVVGVGFLGALLIQLAAAAGARVIAISRRRFARDMARECGAEITLPLDDVAETTDRVTRLTGGRLCERVIEAVGLQDPLDIAGALTAERGRLVIAGFHQDGPRQVDLQLWNWRGLDVVNAHERDPRAYVAGIHAAVDAIADGTLDPAPLLTHRFPLERLSDAMNTARTRPDGFLKALVTT